MWNRTPGALYPPPPCAVTAQTPLPDPMAAPKPWYHNGLRFECQRCGNCCTSNGEYAYVYLAPADQEALAAHLGLTVREFLARHCAEEEGHVLLRMDQPECPFLTPERRCAVYPARPKQCRTWPFWQENLVRERWEGPVKAICPGIGSGPLHSAAEVERQARETEEWYGGD